MMNKQDLLINAKAYFDEAVDEGTDFPNTKMYALLSIAASLLVLAKHFTLKTDV